MGIKRFAYRNLNALLAPLNLTIQPKSTIFGHRIIGEQQLDRMFRSLAERSSPWLESQTLFPVRRNLDIRAEIESFYEAYLTSGFRDPIGGSGFNNLLWIYLITAAYAPAVAIDSGTFKGASAWTMKLAAPDAAILSFDIDLTQLTARAPDVIYLEQDWASFDWSGYDLSESLAYFDDHVDQAKRLLEAKARGIPLCLFDDDMNVFNFPGMAHGGFSIPKVEFVMDDALRQEKDVRWLEGKREHVWEVDVDYLDAAKATIAAADRPPSTSNICGVQQFPCKVVKMAV